MGTRAAHTPDYRPPPPPSVRPIRRSGPTHPGYFRNARKLTSALAMSKIDLRSTSVFLDFDGTISEIDVHVYLLDRLVGSSWHYIEEMYESKVIGSRECVAREWALLTPTEEHFLRSVAAEVPIDPDFSLIVALLQKGGAEATVVSDGFGYYVSERCQTLGVPVVTSQVDWQTRTLLFPYRDERCPCADCGTCKQAPVREAKSRGQTTVFVGDGTSDRKVAPLVDVLYAKDDLATWCDDNEVRYRRFSSLRDVALDLGLLSDGEGMSTSAK